MKRTTAAVMAATLVIGWMQPAACAHAQAAAPFPEVPLESAPRASHTLAWVSMIGGVALIGGSYVVGNRANDRYDEYLVATDPDEIQRLYDETVALDRMSTTSLLVGEALVATGLYLRFLRRPAGSDVVLAVTPRRCALSLRF
jgi:hypothetical protein